ncbi:thiamine biosynthesis lipoprotein ApbE [Catenulispora sp. MAP12-49]
MWRWCHGARSTTQVGPDFRGDLGCHGGERGRRGGDRRDRAPGRAREPGQLGITAGDNRAEYHEHHEHDFFEFLFVFLIVIVIVVLAILVIRFVFFVIVVRPRRHLGCVMSAAAADWRALGCAVRLAVTDPDALTDARQALETWLARVDLACSRFRDDSEIAAFDRSAGRDLPVSQVLADAVAAALRGAELSCGDVDPTVGSALAGLGYDRDFDLVQQGGSPVKLVVRPVPGWRRIRFDAVGRTLAVPSGIRLDLGATAKAWAADRAAAELAATFGCGVLVGLGGDIAVAGPAPQDGWAIRVQDRTDDPDPNAAFTSVLIRDGGLATSGTAARRWTRDGRTLHHIVDPATGLSARTPWRTVSVTAASCLDANIASTAAVIRGGRAPAWLAECGLDARLLAEDGTVCTVGRWPAAPRSTGFAYALDPKGVPSWTPR